MDQTTSTTTATTTPTASAAPATSAPSTVNNASAALAAADSSLAASATPTASTPAAAELQPAESAAPVSVTPEDDPRSPTIPRERFDQVIAQKNQLTEQLKQYDWAKDLQPDEMRGLSQWAQSLRTNPVEAALHLLSTLESDPQHAQALRSHAARTLAAGRQPAPAQAPPDPMPEADLVSTDGTQVYSAPQMQKLREWDQRQMTATLTKQFEARLSPFEQVARKLQESEQAAVYTTTTKSVVDKVTAEVPALKAHLPDIRAVISANPRLEQMALDANTAEFAIRYAANEVYRTKVAPQQLQQSEGQALAHAQQRAVSAVGANPAAAAPVTPASTLGNARAALLAAGVE